MNPARLRHLLSCSAVVFLSFLTSAGALSVNKQPPQPTTLSSSSLHASNVVSASDGDTSTKKKALVVGAGPVGIAMALTLASAPHNYDVRLLESSPQTAYDPTRAFLYNVNLRGQALTSKFPSMQRKLEERGVVSPGFTGTAITIVPADPSAPLPKKKEQVKEDTNSKTEEAKEKEKPGYWIPRNEMVQLMLEVVEEHEEKRAKAGTGSTMGRIDYCPGYESMSVSPLVKEEGDKASSSCVVVTTKDIATGIIETHEATLVVGADGMNSRVRECLATKHSEAFASWSNFNPNSFLVKRWTSPSSFQRIKVLQLPPQFQIPDGEEGNLTTQSDHIYVLRSKHTGPRNYLSLGLLPMRDNNAVRPTNIVTRPDHEIWKYKDGDSVRKWFEESHPRFPFHKDGGMIDDDEWERFAKAAGTRFPACQYSPGMATCSDDGTCGICLVGDAIHAFPPDIGQGVNSGLADVVALDHALRGHDTVTGEEANNSNEAMTFKSNIERYQKQHEPEIASLIRLARFGSPYQYKQPHRIDRLRRNLWTFNVLFRLILNKLTFGLVPNQCIILSQNHNLTFRQVMRRADVTSVTIKAVLLSALSLLLKRKFVGLPAAVLGYMSY